MSDLLLPLYMGGPDSLEAIEPFLRNLFSDRTIIDFRIGNAPQRFLAGKIAKSRARKVAHEYEKMGGSSPQLKHLNGLLEKVRALYLQKTGRTLVTHPGMCYWHPFIEDAVREASATQWERIFVTTLYPQWSYTTGGVCMSRFYATQNISPLSGVMQVTPFWHQDEGYNRCIARRVEKAAAQLSVSVSECHVLFSAHSLPAYTVAKGDPYTQHLNEQIAVITSMVKPHSHSLSYQSRTGPITWLGPETSTRLNELVEMKRPVIVIPISFVSDHIETLIELDEQYLADARKKGMLIARTESLNDADDFAEAFLRIATGVA